MSCIHCVYVQSQRRGIVLKSFWFSIGYSFPYIFNRLRFVAQERGSGNGHVAWSVALKMLVQVWNRVGKITYFGLNKSWENHILWSETGELGFQSFWSPTLYRKTARTNAKWLLTDMSSSCFWISSAFESIFENFSSDFEWRSWIVFSHASRVRVKVWKAFLWFCNLKGYLVNGHKNAFNYII